MIQLSIQKENLQKEKCLNTIRMTNWAKMKVHHTVKPS